MKPTSLCQQSVIERMLLRSLVFIILLITVTFSMAGEPLRVMTFNVRYGTAPDGENHWDHRRDFLVEVIRDASPDLLGAQEMLDFQRDALLAELPGYVSLGVGRDDGAEGGEMSPLFVRKDRFTVREWGTRWLSETPTQPGSLGWGVHYSRLFTWALLRGKQGLDEPLLVINTHWDHESKIARANSAVAIVNWLHETFPHTRHVIVMGDFNCGPTSDPILALKSQAKLRDTIIDGQTAGTFHAFTGKPGTDRIDMILLYGRWQTLDTKVIRTSRDGRYPSDHFPVTAQLIPDD